MSVTRERYELQIAAREGNVEYLKEAAIVKRDVEAKFFLGTLSGSTALKGNMLHLAVECARREFIRVAVEELPNDILQDLLCHRPSTIASANFLGKTPLHTALEKGDLTATELFLSVYDRVGTTLSPARKPWLMRDHEGIRPFDLALEKKYEECLVHMLSLDMDLLCNIDIISSSSPSNKNDKCSLLFFAIANGMNRLASEILNAKTTTYSLIGTNNATPLHVASSSSSSGSVCRLLLEKHPELISRKDKNGYSILHQWAKSGIVWALELFVKDEIPAEASKDLILSVTKQDKQNPLHVAVRYKKPEFVKRLLVLNQQVIEIQATQQSSLDILRMKDINGNTPVHLAMIPGMEDTALSFISLDPALCHVRNKKGESPLLLAVNNGCAKAVKMILGSQVIDFKMLRRNDGMTVIHALSNCPDQEVATLLIEKFWWLMDLKDDARKTALDYAKNNKSSWAVDMLNNHSGINKEKFDWKAACQRKESLAVRAFVCSCPNLENVCRVAKDTPLHHLKLPTYKEYKNFLRIPALMELKNMPDSEGATPLHRALRGENIYLAKALLTDDAVERTLKDHARETAMDILSKLYKKDNEWREMCRSIKVNPHLRNLGPSAVEMRNTLSVVAALLAALTFTAGFTLPGGLNSETGQASLAKKGSFIVFILADTYAMTCSMLVLFCMVWSMVGELDESQVLIDRGIPILIQSFCGTLLAFMTGVFSVMSRQSMWAAAIIIAVCSFVTIIAISRRILYQVTDILHRFLNKLYVNLHKMYKTLLRSFNCLKDDEGIERSRGLEEGRALNPQGGGLNSHQG